MKINIDFDVGRFVGAADNIKTNCDNGVVTYTCDSFRRFFLAEEDFPAPPNQEVTVGFKAIRDSSEEAFEFTCIDVNEDAIELLRIGGIDFEGYRVMEIIQGEQ